MVMGRFVIHSFDFVTEPNTAEFNRTNSTDLFYRCCKNDNVDFVTVGLIQANEQVVDRFERLHKEVRT